jgi:hypothetical protein
MFITRHTLYSTFQNVMINSWKLTFYVVRLIQTSATAAGDNMLRRTWRVECRILPHLCLHIFISVLHTRRVYARNCWCMLYVYGYLLILLRNFIVRLALSLLQDSFIALRVKHRSRTFGIYSKPSLFRLQLIGMSENLDRNTKKWKMLSTVEYML